MDKLWAPWRMAFIDEAVKGAAATHKSTPCVFCQLLQDNDDEASLIIHRGQKSFIVLNKYPYNTGHVMVIPFQHTARFDNLDIATLTEMQSLINRAILILEKSYQPAGYNIGMNLGEAGGAGIKDHLHYHIVPRWPGDTNFMPVLADTKTLPESLSATWHKLNNALTTLT